jgi:hypothetical protein
MRKNLFATLAVASLTAVIGGVAGAFPSSAMPWHWVADTTPRSEPVVVTVTEAVTTTVAPPAEPPTEATTTVAPATTEVHTSTTEAPVTTEVPPATEPSVPHTAPVVNNEPGATASSWDLSCVRETHEATTRIACHWHGIVPAGFTHFMLLRKPDNEKGRVILIEPDPKADGWVDDNVGPVGYSYVLHAMGPGDVSLGHSGAAIVAAG